MITGDSAKSVIRATVSLALGEALITGIDECASCDRPLTQLQRINLATMSIMAYDKALLACDSVDVEEIYSGLRTAK